MCVVCLLGRSSLLLFGTRSVSPVIELLYTFCLLDRLFLEGVKIGVIVGFSIMGFWVLLLFFFLCNIGISWLLLLIVSCKNTFVLERN